MSEELAICDDFHQAVGAATCEADIARAIETALREAERNKIEASEILPMLTDVTCSTNRNVKRRDAEKSGGETDTIAAPNFFAAFMALEQLRRTSS